MAFAATTEWEVRTTGNDANGGGFNTASAGTDYSQQDAPQVTYTDLVIDGTTNTKITSATTPFTSAHVGNVINITGGTGFTVQRVQVVSVDGSNVATCDKAVGTTGSTGGAGKLGGALSTPGQAAALVVAGNKIHVQAGTYTLTTPIAVNGAVAHSWIGYQSTHEDRGTKPLITTSTDGTALFRYSNSAVCIVRFRNLSFSNTASARNDGIRQAAGTAAWGLLAVEDCLFDGLAKAVNGDWGSDAYMWARVCVLRSEIKNCTEYGIRARGSIAAYQSYLHDNAGPAVSGYGEAAATVVADRCIIADNTVGIDLPNEVLVMTSCTVTGNSSHGVSIASPSSIDVGHSIIYDNGGYGINCTNAPTIGGISSHNAYGSNTSGDCNNFPAGQGDVTLTADPFTNAATGDYSLNSTSGGGAACKDAGFQWGD